MFQKGRFQPPCKCMKTGRRKRRRAYCAARSLTIVREYVHAGESGAKESRPELNSLMADARKRRIDAIVVWRFDRFARSTKHLLLALEEFRSLRYPVRQLSGEH